jgi:molecular chaperone GrpE
VAEQKATAEPQSAGPNGPQSANEEARTEDTSAQQAGHAVLEDLDALRARARERDEYLDLLQRARADFANYQKRNLKEREQERRYQHGPVILDLLPVIDNLDRATAAAKQAGETGPLVQGVAMVQSQLLDIFRRYGVASIDAEGQPFDPNQHEAVMQKPAPDTAPNTVLQVLEKGFMIHDRVLRPAKVIVSTK